MARLVTNHGDKKRQIVEAATLVFSQNGFEGTSNKLIAEQMRRTTGRNFTPALIYHYFPEGKGGLFAAVIEQFQPLKNLRDSLEENIEAPPEVFFKQLTRVYLECLKEPGAQGIIRILFQEGPRQPEIAANVVGKLGPILLFPMALYLMQQIQKGCLREVPVPVALFEFFGPLLFRNFVTATVGEYAPFPLPSDEEMIDWHVRGFLEGLLVKGADPE